MLNVQVTILLLIHYIRLTAFFKDNLDKLAREM